MITDIGGALGIWIGFSIITCFEILELITQFVLLSVKKLCRNTDFGHSVTRPTKIKVAPSEQRLQGKFSNRNENVCKTGGNKNIPRYMTRAKRKQLERIMGKSATKVSSVKRRERNKIEDFDFLHSPSPSVTDSNRMDLITEDVGYGPRPPYYKSTFHQHEDYCF